MPGARGRLAAATCLGLLCFAVAASAGHPEPAQLEVDQVIE